MLHSYSSLQFGVIKSIWELVKCYPPIHYNVVWTEFNILDICVTFINQNYTTGTDLVCHCDLIDICVHLLAGEFEIMIWFFVFFYFCYSILEDYVL